MYRFEVALWIAESEKVSVADFDFWASGIINSEVAEQASHALLSRIVPIAELLTMNNIKLFGTTVQENIYNGMWNYGAALSLIMLLLIGIMGLFTNEEDSAQNESGGVI